MKKDLPSKQQAEEAISTLLKYIGENTEREGLTDTPKRVIKSYDELFSGYRADIESIMTKTFSHVQGYDNIISLNNINFTSLCEHHMLPFSGHVNISYIPNDKILGISKFARLVDAFSKRLQIQENMTVQIAQTIEKYLTPKGVYVKVFAYHNCMSMRGVLRENSLMNTSHAIGLFKSDATLLAQINN